MRLQEKQFNEFEQHLDIRNLVHVQTNLAILVRLLLNREQKLLFKY